MRVLLRQHFRFFLFATLAGLGLRLLFIWRFPSVTADSFIYGDIAKNWLQHGIYGLTDPPSIAPTLIRLPGYPAFLAAIFAVFGVEHYRAALFVQMFVDLATCLLIADMARRRISPRAAKAAFLLAALCPFLANYAAAALTETLEVFFTALALDLALVGLELFESGAMLPWMGCGVSMAAAILLRPDGGLLLAAIEAYLLMRLVFRHGKSVRTRPPALYLLKAGLAVALISLAPLVPWTLRNLHTLHRFQPLAPRYANEENEFVPAGFNRWVKTWIADYASVEEVYWQVPGNPVDTDKLPLRAFDSDAQQDETEALLADYNAQLHVSPALDARFAALAQQRIQNAPLRYYVWLPLMRITDMWLRPRTEILPSNTRWWEFDDEPKWLALAIALGLANLVYVVAGLAGITAEGWSGFWSLLLMFIVLRSAFLGTLENPEPRYTLECYPIIILFAVKLLGASSRNMTASHD